VIAALVVTETGADKDSALEMATEVDAAEEAADVCVTLL